MITPFSSSSFVRIIVLFLGTHLPDSQYQRRLNYTPGNKNRDTPAKKNMKKFIIVAVLLGICTPRSAGRELDPEQYIGDPNAPSDEVPPELADDVEWEKAHENTNLALGMACLYGRTELVKEALVNGQMLEMDQDGFAILSTHHSLHHTKKRILYDRDWRFSHKNELNDTCLHRAVMSKEYDIAKILIEHGWDPNAQDKNGHTPLDVAHSRHDELLSHLLEDRGALAKHHRRNMEKFKMHKDQHEREKRAHHDKFVHQHLHEHNEHGAPGHNHWRKNANKMDL